MDQPPEPPPDQPPDQPRPSRRGLARRSFIAATGLTAAATAASAVTAVALEPARRSERVPFRGPHPAGIATPQQAHLRLVAYDITVADVRRLAGLLHRWTGLAEHLTAGRPVAAPSAAREKPPADPGTAADLSPCRLTVTIGFGPSLFDHRFGLAHRRPPALADLPPFPGERLDPRFTGGDVVVQACSDDPQVALHATRVFNEAARGVARPRWVQAGFLPSPPPGTTPRNLFGFRDGTANIRPDDAAALRRHVWASGSDGAGWMAGGSYLVMRRIRMLVEKWDASSLEEQENTFGRHKLSGAPYGGAREFDRPHLDRLPADAHVRLAAAETNGGIRLLRRGYSYADGLDSGLLFLAYQRDPRAQFVPMMRRLAAHDALNEYTQHVGSALFACPPGVGATGWWGQELFPELSV